MLTHDVGRGETCLSCTDDPWIAIKHEAEVWLVVRERGEREKKRCRERERESTSAWPRLLLLEQELGRADESGPLDYVSEEAAYSQVGDEDQHHQPPRMSKRQKIWSDFRSGVRRSNWPGPSRWPQFSPLPESLRPAEKRQQKKENQGKRWARGTSLSKAKVFEKGSKDKGKEGIGPDSLSSG